MCEWALPCKVPSGMFPSVAPATPPEAVHEPQPGRRWLGSPTMAGWRLARRHGSTETLQDKPVQCAPVILLDHALFQPEGMIQPDQNLRDARARPAAQASGLRWVWPCGLHGSHRHFGLGWDCRSLRSTFAM